MRRYFSILFLSLGLASVLLLNSCLKEEDTDLIPVAGLLTVNAYSHSDAVIFFAENKRLFPEEGLKFKEFSRPIRGGYFGIFAGTRRIRVSPLWDYNEGSILADTSVVIRENVTYTSLIYGKKENASLAIVEDNEIPNIGEDIAGIRFFNLAQGAGIVSLKIEGQDGYESWASNRDEDTPKSMRKFQDFEEAKSGKYTLTVQNSDGEALAIREDVEFRSQHYLTVFLMNNTEGSENPFYLGVIPH